MSVITDQSQDKELVNGYNGVLPIVFPIAENLYKLRDNWHVRRSKKRCSFDHSRDADRRAHNGVDIGGKFGIPVYSCAKGIVIEAPVDDFPVDRYGNSVWLQSTQEDLTFGYRFLYAHLDELLVETGNEVDAATQIGTLGMTGNALRPHLHFEIHYPAADSFLCKKCQPEHKNVTAINPYPSLSQAAARQKNNTDIAAEKRIVVLTTAGNTIKSLFKRIKLEKRA